MTKKNIIISSIEAQMPSRIKALLGKVKISVGDLLFNTLETLGMLHRVPAKVKVLLTILIISGAINKIVGQSTDNLGQTINAQYIHAALADNYNANGAAANEAMLNNIVLAIQDGFDNNDIRLYNEQFVFTITRTDAPELTTNNNHIDDLNDFYDWYTVNGDTRDFQVCFFETAAYQAESLNGATAEGWCRTVVGGGANWTYTFSHELLHTMGVLYIGHQQALTDATWQFNPGSGWNTQIDGKGMEESNTGDTYLDGVYGTPIEYNRHSTANGGDGYRNFTVFSQEFPARIAVADMDIDNEFTNVTQGAVDFYSTYSWKIRHIPIADYGFTTEDVAPTAQAVVNGNSVSFGNSSACNVHFPVTTDTDFQDDYFIEGTYEGYLYLASNPADGAQIAGPIALDESFTNLTNGDYVVRYYERRSNTLGAQSNVFSIDGVPPTGTITSDVETITNLPSFAVTFNFSEPIDPATFIQSDISKTNCDLSGLTFNGDNTAVTVDVAPLLDGTVSLWINANKFKDLGGNWNIAIDPWAIIYDGTGSAVNFTTPEYPKTNENPVPYTMTITEPNGINGLDASDIETDDGTVTNWDYNGGNVATFDFVPDNTTGTSSYSIGVAEDAFYDDANNGNQSSTAEGELDYEPPYSEDGFQCEVGGTTNLSSFPMSVQFNEALVDFDASKLNKTNCTVTDFQDNGNGNYSWNVIPGNNGLVGISMDANVCYDFVGGNGNIAVPEWTTTYDGIAPTGEMTTTLTNPTSASTVDVNGSTDEETIGFDSSDFEIDNGNLENIVFNGQTFSFDITSFGEGLITVTVPAGSFTDAAGNPNEEFWFTIVSDQTAPTLDITYDETSPTNVDLIHVNFDASEIINLNASAIIVENGVLVEFSGSGDNYNGEIEPNGDGDVVTSVDGEDYSDEAENTGTSATGTIESDRTAPQLTIDGPTAIYSGNDAEMTYTADELITDFDNSDIETDNGESTNFAGFGNLYTSTIANANPGQIHVNVTGDYFDIAGNEGLTVEEFTVDVITGTPEVTAVEGTNVYPNPTKDIINIETGESIQEVIIYNSFGQKVIQREFSKNTNTDSNRIAVDVSGLPTGIYVLFIDSDKKHFTTKKFFKD